jgi:hypothetical protein
LKDEEVDMKKLTAEYCVRRMREEKRAAEAASSMEAAIAHRQLAREFLAKARTLRANVNQAS